MNPQYPYSLKKKLCEEICIHAKSTKETAKEYGVPLKKLEKWIIEGLRKSCSLISKSILLIMSLLKSISNIYYFNNERTQAALNYLTPIQYKNMSV